MLLKLIQPSKRNRLDNFNGPSGMAINYWGRGQLGCAYPTQHLIIDTQGGPQVHFLDVNEKLPGFDRNGNIRAPALDQYGDWQWVCRGLPESPLGWLPGQDFLLRETSCFGGRTRSHNAELGNLDMLQCCTRWWPGYRECRCARQPARPIRSMAGAHL